MSKYSIQSREEHKELVRNALALKPRASISIIAGMLEKSGRKLDPNYIGKLKNKIIRERQLRFSQKKVNERISEIEEKASIVQEKLWEILLGKFSTDQTKIKAGEAIISIEKKLFESQMDAGLFERKLGELEVKHSLNPEDPTMQSIMQAFRNYGIIRKATVIEPTQIDGSTNRAGSDTTND